MPVLWFSCGNPSSRGSLFDAPHSSVINRPFQLVTLPYNLLLQKSAREALGIDLSNQIVIIDEAHSRCYYFRGSSSNHSSDLIPTLLSLSSVRVTSYILSASLIQVAAYYEKFRTRLSAQHGLHLKRLIKYMEAMQKVMEDWKATKTKAGSATDERTEVLTISNFMEKLGRNAVGINLLEIEAYLKRSKVHSIALDFEHLLNGRHRLQEK